MCLVCCFVNSVFTALPTPFYRGEIDFDSFESLLNVQVVGGVDGVVISGSTGEGHNLSKDEWIKLVDFGAKKINHKIKVIAGVGFNSTKSAVEYAQVAEQLGGDEILLTVPYYNKPQQDGIYTHFAEVCKSVKTKIIIYNVPSRTVTDIQNDTIVRLVKDFDNIVALKDATGKLERVTDLKAKISKIWKATILQRTNSFQMLSGEDATQIGFNAMGGEGV